VRRTAKRASLLPCSQFSFLEMPNSWKKMKVFLLLFLDFSLVSLFCLGIHNL
jgi:hypothetical protein